MHAVNIVDRAGKGGMWTRRGQTPRLLRVAERGYQSYCSTICKIPYLWFGFVELKRATAICVVGLRV